MQPPTPEQQSVIDEPGNCVVLAGPGSGKTFTLACKIQTILPSLPSYKGVIAISYTNKASNELERRSLASGIDRKGSFFGTIDSFFLGEIISPFGSHVFGFPQQEIRVVEKKTIEELMDINLALSTYDLMVPKYIPFLGELYIKGHVVLETFGFLAVYIFDHSPACRRYLKARYSHIIIDEYQDCGDWQHTMFLNLVRLGLRGIAVGDANQSIFAFAKKDSRYLTNLAQQNTFALYSIEKNHRCHPSIVNYSLRLLSHTSKMLPTDEIRVFRKHSNGSEIEIAKWLTKVIPGLAQKHNITSLNQIAILVRDKNTAELIDQNLAVSHKYVKSSVLDEDVSLHGVLYRKILNWYFSPELTKHELVEGYLNFDSQLATTQKVMQLLREIEHMTQGDFTKLVNCFDRFTFIADLIFPKAYNANATDKLLGVLMDKEKLTSFIPATPQEVQIMTLHKSKGLEFELVFHLNLYDYSFLQRNNNGYNQYEQDLHLHYVGITRARSFCVLCTSSQRHSKMGKIIPASESEFLSLYDLNALRRELP